MERCTGAARSDQNTRRNKRGKGRNIFKRKVGRWEARYIKERDPFGKIRYGYCYGKTYHAAKEKAEQCRAALRSGQPLRPHVVALPVRLRRAVRGRSA